MDGIIMIKLSFKRRKFFPHSERKKDMVAMTL
jgi:hypothetical protein